MVSCVSFCNIRHKAQQSIHWKVSKGWNGFLSVEHDLPSSLLLLPSKIPLKMLLLGDKRLPETAWEGSEVCCGSRELAPPHRNSLANMSTEIICCEQNCLWGHYNLFTMVHIVIDMDGQVCITQCLTSSFIFILDSVCTYKLPKQEEGRVTRRFFCLPWRWSQQEDTSVLTTSSIELWAQQCCYWGWSSPLVVWPDKGN